MSDDDTCYSSYSESEIISNHPTSGSLRNLDGTNVLTAPCNSVISENENPPNAIESFVGSKVTNENNYFDALVSEASLSSDFDYDIESISKSHYETQPYHSTPVKNISLPDRNVLDLSDIPHVLDHDTDIIPKSYNLAAPYHSTPKKFLSSKGRSNSIAPNILQGELFESTIRPLEQHGIANQNGIGLNALVSNESIDSNFNTVSENVILQSYKAAPVKFLGLHSRNDVTVSDIQDISEGEISESTITSLGKPGIYVNHPLVSEGSIHSDFNVDAKNTPRSVGIAQHCSSIPEKLSSFPVSDSITVSNFSDVSEGELIESTIELLGKSSINVNPSVSEISTAFNFSGSEKNVQKLTNISQPYHSTAVNILPSRSNRNLPNFSDIYEDQTLKSTIKTLKAANGNNTNSNYSVSEGPIYSISTIIPENGSSESDKVAQTDHTSEVGHLNLHHINYGTVTENSDEALIENTMEPIDQSNTKGNSITESNASVCGEGSDLESNTGAELSRSEGKEATENIDSTTDQETFTSSSTNSTTKTCSTIESSNNIPIDTSTSAWEQWLLEKEKTRRKELLIQMEKNKKDIQAEKQMIESKITERQKADEVFLKWLSSKNKEIANRKSMERLSISEKEKTDQIAKEKSNILIQAQIERWKEQKRTERSFKQKAESVEKARALKESEERKIKSETAYEQWLQRHCKPRRNLYSYGYNGGTIVCYYDATSPPPPSFCNPRPWTFPS